MIHKSADLQAIARNHGAVVHFDEVFTHTESGAMLQVALIVRHEDDQVHIVAVYLDTPHGFVPMPHASMDLKFREYIGDAI